MLSQTFWITFSILLTLTAFLSLAICRHTERCGRPCQTLFFGVFLVVAIFTVSSLAAQTSTWILPALALAGMSIGGTIDASNEAVPRGCP